MIMRKAVGGPWPSRRLLLPRLGWRSSATSSAWWTDAPDLADCTQPSMPHRRWPRSATATSTCPRRWWTSSSPIITADPPCPARPGQLPLRTVEAEWGPGQLEITLDPLSGLAAADAMIMIRTAVKQVSRRHGLHRHLHDQARPAQRLLVSGWHLHQSLADLGWRTEPTRSPIGGRAALDRPGCTTSAACCGTCVPGPRSPTPRSTATSASTPTRWHRSAPCGRTTTRPRMVRLIGGPGRYIATHFENRSGEPVANPVPVHGHPDLRRARRHGERDRTPAGR